MSDLWETLGGAPAHPDWQDPRGRLMVTVRSDCGARIASVYQEPTFPMVIVSGYKLTRAHTNMVIFDQALLDIEQLARMEADAPDGTVIDREAKVITQLLEALKGPSTRLPRLAIPETRADVQTLARQVKAERERAIAERYKPRAFDGLATACTKCKTIFYLGDELADWWSAGAQERQLVARQPQDLSRNAGWTFDQAQLAQRLAAYEQLVALLESV